MSRSSEGRHIEASHFRKIVGRFASGVTVLGTHDGQRARGLTVAAFMSVSLQPPLVASSVPALVREGLPAATQRFTVSILAQHQESLAGRYGQWQRLHHSTFRVVHGLPVVTGSLAWLLCTVHERQEVGNGTIVIGRVEDVGLGEGDPLLRFDDEHAKLRGLQLSD